MAGADEVLACQRRLASLVERMLALARDAQWKQLPELDAQCTGIVAQLHDMALPDASKAERASVAQLFTRIGNDQAELNALVRPQFVDLMRTVGAQRRPRDRMRGRKPTHDPEKCPPGDARSSAGRHPH